MTSVNSLLDFISYTEGLKKELRNSWLSNGRRESVADHSWRMAMMAIVLMPRMKVNLSTEKVLKMAIIHDLAEIETGDIPTIHQTSTIIAQNSKDEDRAFVKISSTLEDTVTDELYELWQEFENQKTPEARFVKAIDKLECVIQKNQQSVDKNAGAPGYFEKLAKLCADDSTLEDFYNRVVEDVKNRDHITDDHLKEMGVGTKGDSK